MGLIFNILLSLFFAAVGFLLKLALIYYAIALVLLGIYWAFYETAVGWYVVAGIMLIVILIKSIATSRKAET